MVEIIGLILFILFYLFLYFLFFRLLYSPDYDLWTRILLLTPLNVPYILFGILLFEIKQSDWYCSITNSISKKYKNIRRKILYKKLYEKMMDIDPYCEEIWEE